MNLGQWETSNWDNAVLTKKLVHIHHADQYFNGSPMAELHIQGTIKTILKELHTRLENAQKTGQIKSELSTTSPELLNHHQYQPMQKVGQMLPPPAMTEQKRAKMPPPPPQHITTKNSQQKISNNE